MNFAEYIKKWDKQVIDFDGYFGYQCVDFVRHYCREVLGLTLGPSGGSAKTMWFNKSGTFNFKWERIVNNSKDKNQVPQEGDIIFFIGGKYEQYGHVGVCVKGYPGQNRFTAIDQNTGSGNGDGKYNNRIRIQDYTFKNVAGWYRLKKTEDKIDESQIVQENLDLKKKLEEETRLKEQYLNENTILRRRADEARLALDGKL